MALVSVITGASSGIGEATARRLAREPGVRLVLVARRRERLERLAQELGGATVVATDLTSAQAPVAVREAVERDHGELHLLVNNAGASWRGRFGDTGWANVQRHLTVNFEAPVRLTEALLPQLPAYGGGVGRGHRAGSAGIRFASGLDRERRLDGGPRLAAGRRGLFGQQGGVRDVDRRVGARGVRGRRPRRPRVAGVRAPLRLPRDRATRAGAYSLGAFDAREGGRGDPRGRARQERRALRAPSVLARGGRADSGPAVVRRVTAGGAFTTTRASE